MRSVSHSEIQKMFSRLLVSLAVAALLVAESSSFHVRIINGTEAEEGEFPFAVNLRSAYDRDHVCGGTILNANFILSAAHCVDCVGTSGAPPEEFDIQYGLTTITTDNTNAVKLKNIYCNNFTYTNDDDIYQSFYDTSVLELAEPLPDDGSWEPVKLARIFNSTVQQQGVVIGWGFIRDDGLGLKDFYSTKVLHKLTVDIYNDTVCGKHYTPDHHVCFGAPSGFGGACYGDSGTAVLVDGLQVGVASFIANATCGYADQNQPNIYARVEKYFDWIKDIAGDVDSN